MTPSISHLTDEEHQEWYENELWLKQPFVEEQAYYEDAMSYRRLFQTISELRGEPTDEQLADLVVMQQNEILELRQKVARGNDLYRIAKSVNEDDDEHSRSLAIALEVYAETVLGETPNEQ